MMIKYYGFNLFKKIYFHFVFDPAPEHINAFQIKLAVGVDFVINKNINRHYLLWFVNDGYKKKFKNHFEIV